MLESMNEWQSREVQASLDELLVAAEAQAVYLCDRGGNILADSTIEQYDDYDNIVALGAGSFSATRELARMIGEPEFNSVFHQGSKMSLYMQGAPYECLILVIFGNTTNAGMVKIYSKKTCQGLQRTLAADAVGAGQNEGEATVFELNPDAKPFGAE